MFGTYWGKPKIFKKPLLGVLGAALLFLMVKHCSPWHMCNILLQAGPPRFIEFRVPFLGCFTITTFYFILLSCILLPTAAFLFQSVRISAARLLENKTSLIFSSLSLIFFYGTVFSGFFLKEKMSPPEMPVFSVVLYLTLGLYGVCILFAGISGAIAELGIWNRLRSCIFTAKLPLYLAALFGIEFFLTNFISFFALEHIPHIQDSFAQLFQGEIFSRGYLTAPSPPVKELFYYDHIINNEKWYSQFPPGHSVLMMLGVLVGMPWIVNPLLGSATVVAMYFLGRELYSDAIGRVAALFTLLSPFILFMSSEYMNHSSGLLLFTLFVLFYARAVRLQSIMSALIAGAALGWIANIRPLSAVTLAMPFGLFTLYLLWIKFKTHWLLFSAMAGSAGLLVAALLMYNYMTNGDPFLFGYIVLHGMGHLPGFGHAAWGEPHTLVKGIQQTLNNLVGLNKYLFEWPIPSLTFVFVLVASRRLNRWDGMLLGSFFCLSIGYIFYWYQDWCFGPRFLYEASGCVILLTVRGMQCTPYLIKKVFGRPIPVRRISGGVTALIVFCFAYGLITNGPPLYKDYSTTYRGMDAKLQKIVQKMNAGKSLVFISFIYSRPLMPNSPFLDTETVYVWDTQDTRDTHAYREKAMALFPGYRYFVEKDYTLKEIFRHKNH